MSNKNLNDSDKCRVNQSVEYGEKNVTRDDGIEILNKEEKVNEKMQHLGGALEKAKLLFMMLKDYFGGAYKDVPWSLIAAIIFAFVYLLSPIDVIPDFIPGLGYIDDIAVFGLVVGRFSSAISDYKKWKESQMK